VDQGERAQEPFNFGARRAEAVEVGCERLPGVTGQAFAPAGPAGVDADLAVDESACGHPGHQEGRTCAPGDAGGNSGRQVLQAPVWRAGVGILGVFKEGLGIGGDVTGGEVDRLV
jgi:hypothetical protein